MTKLKQKASKIVLMSFAAGEEATENTAVFQKYIGVSPVSIVALNPTKEELETLLGRSISKNLEYFSKDASGANQIRLDFWVKPDANWGRQLDVPLQKITFFISETVSINKDKTKVQVIDKYGNTGWVTKEDFKLKNVPENFKRLTNTYRECYSGEDRLIDFLKKWLNIPENSVYKNGVWEFIPDMSKCEAEFKNIKSLIKGDIKDLQTLIKKYPSYKVKVAFGVKTTEDNKKYQTVYTGLFLKHSSGYYDRFDTAIKADKERGALTNVEFSSEQLKPYEVEPTVFENTMTSSIPNTLPDTRPSTILEPELNYTDVQLEEDGLPF